MHADRLKQCGVCGRKFTTSQARSKHEPTCKRSQQLPVGQPHASFRKLFPPAAILLLDLLCSLDTHDIPEIIFCRLRKDRTYGGSDGEVEHAAVPVADSLVNLLSDHQFEAAI